MTRLLLSDAWLLLVKCPPELKAGATDPRQVSPVTPSARCHWPLPSPATSEEWGDAGRPHLGRGGRAQVSRRGVRSAERQPAARAGVSAEGGGEAAEPRRVALETPSGGWRGGRRPRGRQEPPGAPRPGPLSRHRGAGGTEVKPTGAAVRGRHGLRPPWGANPAATREACRGGDARAQAPVLLGGASADPAP